MLNIFKSKMALVADVFPNIRNLKNVVTSISKKSCFRSPFEKQDIKRDQILLKVERHHIYHLYWSHWGQFSSKKSLLVICKIFRQFVNTVTAHDKYVFPIRDNLTQPIQMHLYQKQKNFLKFFRQRLKSSLNFEHFEAKEYLMLFRN